MDVSSIARLSTDMANERTSVAVGTAVLKQAIDLQEMVVTQLLDAIPALPANPNIGRNINTTA
ncbi:YjfB family protein [Oxalobacter sp. OttesenSCG-928-P03]|nr:YjfB family protein [Oxalobacter sp. OttesenSCG-928-P03]